MKLSVKKMLGIAIITLTSTTATLAQNYTLKGEVHSAFKERMEGGPIYITSMETKQNIDSTKVKDGKFAFKGKVAKEMLCYISFGPNRLPFVLQPGDIVCDGENFSFSGTAANDIAAEFTKPKSEIFSEHTKAYQQLAESNDPQVEKARRFKYHSSRFNRRMDSLYTAFCSANGDGAINAWLINDWVNMVGDNVQRFDKAWAFACNYAKSIPSLKTTADRMEHLRNTLPGKPFIDFTVEKGYVDGSTARLSDVIGKGKYILVDFWASWCGPCRGEIPNIKQAYEKFHGDRFDVLSVAVWDQEPRTRKALKEEKMPWTQIINADKDLTTAYGINGIPQIMLFAPDGTIAARGLRGVNVASTIEQFLNQTAVIEGKAEGLAEGDTISLLRNGNFMEKEGNSLVATTTVKNGKYRFEIDCKGKVICGFVTSKAGMCGVIVEPGNITANLDKGGKGNATGTWQNDLYARYEHQRDSIMKLVNAEIADLGKLEYNESIAKGREIQSRHMDPFDRETLELIRDNSGSAVAEMLFYYYSMGKNAKDMKAILDDMGDYEYSYRPLIGYAKKLASACKTVPGSKFIDFTVKDGTADGKPVSLSDYVGKGKYVLVDFWASWCGWCRKESPNVKMLYEKYNGDKFTVLGLAISDKKENTLKAMKEDKVTWPQIFNCGNKPLITYGINGIPQIMLFAPDGTLVARDLRGEELIKTVEEALKGK